MRRTRLDEPIELRLVLSVAPWTYAERPAAIRDRSEHVEWRAALAHPVMERIVRDVLDGKGIPGFPDEHGAEDAPIDDRVIELRGGYALFSAGHPVIEPTCCGDIGNLDDWEEALRERPASGTIWIGHPSLLVEFGAATLVLRYEHQPGEEFELPIDSLARAAARAREELAAFAGALLPTVKAVVRNDAHAREITELMTGTPLGAPASGSGSCR
jgi:hypothetical protein